MSETPVEPTPEPVPDAPAPTGAPASRDSSKALIAIGGIAAAGLVILAGVGGYAVGQYNGSHRTESVELTRAEGALPGPQGNAQPGMPGDMNGRNGQDPRGVDPDGDNWTGSNRMGGQGNGMQGNGMQGNGMPGNGMPGFGQGDGGRGNGMQGFGQGNGMPGLGGGDALQNLPPQIQELLKQFLQGQGGPQGRLQLPGNPGAQG